MDSVEAFLARGGEIKKIPAVYGSGITAPVSEPVPLTKNGHRNPLSRRTTPPPVKRMSRAEATRAAQQGRKDKYLARAAKAKAAYERGEEIPEIARLMGVCKKTVRGFLRLFGIELRKIAPRAKRDIEEDVLAAHRDGLTAQEIADKLEAHAQNVRKVLRRHGLITNVGVHPKAYPVETLRAIADRYAQGYGTLDCKRHFQCSQATVLKAVRLFKVPVRPIGAYAPMTKR